MSVMTNKAIRAGRRRAGKTVREIAIALGVTERTYARWESGEVQPDGQNLVALADLFGCHPRELLTARDR